MLVAAGHREWSVHWLSRPFTAAFHFGATPVSFWLGLLLALCTACAIPTTRVARSRDFVALLLMLEGTMLGLFLARDLLVFALFWDLMLIPVFFGLLGWGEHPATAWRYFIYNFAGGLTLLLATAAFGVIYGSTDVIGRSVTPLVGAWAPWIYAGFAFAFLVKTPVWPLHTWMPPTYSGMPAPMVAVVSAVQSKAGLYGFIAIALALLPQYVHAYATPLIVLAAISLIYGAVDRAGAKRCEAHRRVFVALALRSHRDRDRFAAIRWRSRARSSISSRTGSFRRRSFLLLGYSKNAKDTRSLLRLGGLGWKNPRLAGALCIAALAALGLPGLAGFAGELVILIGVYQAGYVWPVVVALIAIVIASAYMIRLYQDLMNGPEVEDVPVRADLTWLEGLAVAPLLVALIALGVDPAPLLRL